MNEERYLGPEFEAFLEQPLSSDDRSGLSREMEGDDLPFRSNTSSTSPGFGKRQKFLKSNDLKHDIKNSIDGGGGGGGNDVSDDTLDSCESGKDRLEEKLDEERFLKALEKNGDTVPHFGLLNKQLLTSDVLEQRPSFDGDGLRNSMNEETDQIGHENRSGSNSGSSSERKSRILEAINKRSLEISVLDSLEITKTSHDEEKELLEPVKHPDDDVKASDISIGDAAPVEARRVSSALDPASESPANSRELEFEMQRNEFQQISKDYYELKHNTSTIIGDSEPVDSVKGEEGGYKDDPQQKFLEMEAEMKQQEILLRRYNDENKKLYLDLKDARKIFHDRDVISEENVKLRKELNYVKSKGVATSNQRQSKMDVGLASRIEQLETELKLALKRNSDLSGEMQLLESKLKGKSNAGSTRVLRKSFIPTLTSTSKKKSSGEWMKNDHNVVEYLERRVKTLEEELGRKEEEEDERLKMLREDFVNIKDHYQEHVQKLEEELDRKQADDTSIENACSSAACQTKLIQMDKLVGRLKDKLKHFEANNTRYTREQCVNTTKELQLPSQESHRKIVQENFELKSKALSIKSKHEAEMQALQLAHSMEKKSHEVLLRQLRENLQQSNSKLEKAAPLLKDYSRLEMEVTKLKETLREAKQLQSPDMRNLEDMKEKILEMKASLARRDQNLNELLKSTSDGRPDGACNLSLLESKHREERERWRRLVLEKVNEIDHFRQQLDLVLDFMKKLKTRGMTDVTDLVSLSDDLRHFNLHSVNYLT